MIDRIEVTDPPAVVEATAAFSGRVAWDIGANIGQAAKRLRENFVHVYSFEPHPESYKVLLAEAPEGVHAENIAVSDHDGEVDLCIAARSKNSGQYVNGTGLHWGTIEHVVSVTCRSIDSLVTEFPAPHFIKVDTEGHEVAVLQGAEKVIYEMRPSWLVEVHSRHNERPIRRMLADYDITKLEHEALQPDSMLRLDHFWLVAK